MLTFSNCSQKANINRLLDKEDTRTELFNTIIDNHDLMTEFMNAMRENNHASMMMGNQQHMDGMHMNNNHGMMNNEQMIEMMKSNPKMMKDMMGHMIEMMKDNPDLFNLCIQKMQDNGLMGADGHIKMMDKESQIEK